MQLLVFAGEDYYPNEYFGDFRGSMPAPGGRWRDSLPSAAELAAYLASLKAPTWPGQAPIERCSWIAILAVDGQAPPQRQCWDLLSAPGAHPNPEAHLARRGCSAWWRLPSKWLGIRLNDSVSVSLLP